MGVITDAAGVLTGDVYSFPDGAPNKSEEGQTGGDFSQDPVTGNLSGEAATQLEMNETAKEMYRLWDDTLNAAWKLLEANLSESDMEVLRKEESEWIASREAEVQAVGLENEGGSLQPLVEAMKAAELTKARVYELAKYAEGK